MKWNKEKTSVNVIFYDCMADVFLYVFDVFADSFICVMIMLCS